MSKHLDFNLDSLDENSKEFELERQKISVLNTGQDDESNPDSPINIAAVLILILVIFFIIAFLG